MKKQYKNIMFHWLVILKRRQVQQFEIVYTWINHI